MPTNQVVFWAADVADFLDQISLPSSWWWWSSCRWSTNQLTEWSRVAWMAVVIVHQGMATAIKTYSRLQYFSTISTLWEFCLVLHETNVKIKANWDRFRRCCQAKKASSFLIGGTIEFLILVLHLKLLNCTCWRVRALHENYKREEGCCRRDFEQRKRAMTLQIRLDVIKC